MTVIFCSAKLGKLLNVKNKVQSDDHAPAGMGNWNAHLFYHNRKKHIIFMNKLSIYSAVVYNYKKGDLLTLKLLFLKALEAQCQWDNISLPKEVLRSNFSEVTFSTTDNDKSAIGSLNDLIYHAQASLDAGSPAVHLTPDHNILFNMNQMPVSTIKFDYPSERLVTLFGGAL